MNDRRSLLVAVSCPSAVMVGWLALSFSAYAPALIENGGADAAAVSRAKDLSRLELADIPRAATIDDGIALTADIAAAAATTPVVATVEASRPEAPAPTVQIASADPTDIVPAGPTPPQIAPEPAPAVTSEAAEPVPVASEAAAEPAQAPPINLASADPGDVVPQDALSPAAIASGPVPESKPPPADTVAVLDECFAMDACIDRYLWALYQRTPKEDSIKVEDRRAVTIRRKGRTVTVMRSFTKLVDEDFSWKDPKAAAHANMPLMDYVIGGMDKSFKQKLFHMLLAAEAAGLSPGITSAFRDDYRQEIASGLKAASNRSYHGGSLRGGYGHGMAADIVSTQGNNRAQRWASTEVLWKWVDANAKALGIGRPYLGRDPPHVGPIDGAEYISKRGVATDRKEAANTKSKKARTVASAKPPKAQAAREQKSAAKSQKSAQSAGRKRTT
ncbi:hypothetical protein ACVWZ4_006338 [Bradyrhizobium sp. USDA 4472]